MKRKNTIISIGESDPDSDTSETKSSIQKKIHIDSKDNIMSGSEHSIEEEPVKEQEKDNSFYQRCKNYLNAVDPKGYNYYSLIKTIEADIEDKVDLNQYIKAIFAAHDDFFEKKEDRIDTFKQATAAVYMIYKEKNINLGIGNNLKEAIYEDLKDAIGRETSVEVMGFLENYEG